jgi:hypothetical protein
MSNISSELTALFNRIPRRHSADNVKEINSILTEYEDILIAIESVNTWYEKNINKFFDDVSEIKATVKKSTDNKASKKGKDDFFDDASGALKDSIEAAISLYADGERTA